MEKNYMIKPRLSNIYLKIQLYKRCEKENLSLNRLALPRKQKEYLHICKSKGGGPIPLQQNKRSQLTLSIYSSQLIVTIPNKRTQTNRLD